MGRYTQQVDLTIHQDWTDAIAMHTEISQKVKTNSSDITKVHVENVFCTRYTLGDSYEADWGKFPPNSEHLTCDTLLLRGKALLDSLPWVYQLFEDTKEIDPIVNHTGIYDLIGSYFDHVDGPDLPTSLIWFYDTYESYTIVYDDEVIERFPSAKNTAWMFDTQARHRVENTSPSRYAFVIRFAQPFKVCQEWFLNHPNLVYGNV